MGAGYGCTGCIGDVDREMEAKYFQEAMPKQAKIELRFTTHHI